MGQCSKDTAGLVEIGAGLKGHFMAFKFMAVNVGKGHVSANCSVLCGQKYTKLMDDYHAVFQLGSTFVLVELPPYLHTTKCTLPTILVLVFDIVLVPSSEPSKPVKMYF